MLPSAPAVSQVAVGHEHRGVGEAAVHLLDEKLHGFLDEGVKAGLTRVARQGGVLRVEIMGQDIAGIHDDGNAAGPGGHVVQRRFEQDVVAVAAVGRIRGLARTRPECPSRRTHPRRPGSGPGRDRRRDRSGRRKKAGMCPRCLCRPCCLPGGLQPGSVPSVCPGVSGRSTFCQGLLNVGPVAPLASPPRPAGRAGWAARACSLMRTNRTCQPCMCSFWNTTVRCPNRPPPNQPSDLSCNTANVSSVAFLVRLLLFKA